jgi:hypothetical protein
MKVLLTCFSLMIAVSYNAVALADLEERCRYDQLASRSDATGRNQWAHKCGYIKSPAMLNALNSEGTYIVFSNGRKGGGSGNKDVPITEDAACVEGLIKQGFCFTGCYAPEQALRFSVGTVAIAAAYGEKLQQVESLAANSRADDISFMAQPIKSYIAGETKENLISFSTDRGNNLRVTAEHPLVEASGMLVKARTLHVGSRLLTAEGEIATITELSTTPYEGKVWNVRPRSQNKQENILIAEGLFTGSHRFQSQWSDDITRLYFRSEANISGL